MQARKLSLQDKQDIFAKTKQAMCICSWDK